MSCIVGIVAASLGCCVCCQCCRPMPKEPETEGRPPAPKAVGVTGVTLPLGSRPSRPRTLPTVAPGSPVPMERLDLGELKDPKFVPDPKFMPKPPVLVVGTPSPKQARNKMDAFFSRTLSRARQMLFDAQVGAILGTFSAKVGPSKPQLPFFLTSSLYEPNSWAGN